MRTFEHKYSLKEAIDGLLAWEHGCRDSGLNDPHLARHVKEYLTDLNGTEFRQVTAKLVQDMYLSDVKIQQGYGLSDVREFMNFIEDLMGLDVWS